MNDKSLKELHEELVKATERLESQRAYVEGLLLTIKVHTKSADSPHCQFKDNDELTEYLQRKPAHDLVAGMLQHKTVQ